MNAEKFSQYLLTLIAEKGRDVDADLGRPGQINLCYRNLIEFIEANASQPMRNAIYDTLVKIDVANGDVFHYLDHLVTGMIAAMGVSA